MKYCYVAILTGVVLAAAAPARAQYGLYGAPEMLRLSQTSSATAPQYAYPGVPVNPSYSPGPAHFSIPAPQPMSTPVGFLTPPLVRSPGRFAYAPPAQASPGDAGPREAPRLEPIPPEGPSVVNQMLQESAAYPDTGACGVDYGSGMGGDYGCAPSEPRCDSPWYANARWLIMGRDEPNTLWTSFETGNNPNQLPSDIGLRWGNGGQITFGRTFHCDEWGLEATYWGLDPLEGHTSVTHPNTVSTPLDFSNVAYANPLIFGLPVDLFDGADEHRLWRSDEIHNVELNLVHAPFESGYGGDPYGGWGNLDINWLIGVRFFRFDERWAFHSLRGGGSWANPADIGRLEDDSINNLVGFQFGFNVDYHFRQNLKLFAKPKFGIYNNQIEHTFRAFRGDGELFAPDPGSGVAGSYPVHSITNALSFLTEVDLGVDWQLTPQWSAFVGYRVVVATGIALADNQIPPFIVDIPELTAIDRNGQLVLHGAFAGVSYNF